MRSFFRFETIAWITLLFACIGTTHSAYADVSVIDDGKRTVRLTQPAKRIISLAPHVTELVFAAGAGKQLVGVSEYSDYPEDAKKVASIGSIFALDLERLIALKPDLVIIWGTGNAKHLAQKLRDNQLTVYENEPHSFEDIASSIEKIAILSGTEVVGKENARLFRQRLQSLNQEYQLKNKQTPVRVFHQMVKSPLMTVNKDHFVSKMIEICGGTNVFGDLKDISATITVEAMLATNPDVIFSSGKESGKLQNEWNQFPNLSAVKKKNLFSIPGDWLHRAGPRVLDATEMLCKQIREARTRQ
ncbi:cobalamin-binding protein [Undibacterium cyanobacteriorum]|uniref:Cobalamin-binding protein n=1 Tax=Undibacterium cyanobacteriorum TaxID=3073561 RepID=A0ABY9REI2_9BURK|nr:cobalamin-binding protein [Undibacterium sp. 20NA77.5]WMW79065.1 cobalamin-binding protein [Undibacterium sp. 20NA77.5]